MSQRSRVYSMLLILVAVLSLFMPSTLQASENTRTPRTVKVGFYAYEGYHEMDAEGNKSGYGYDFLKLTQKYANINYEYVGYDKTWAEMQVMLLNGEIDMVTSAHRSDRSDALYDFSMPIGEDKVTISCRYLDSRFIADDYASYDGMVLGLLESSSLNNEVLAYAREKHFNYEARYYSSSEELKIALNQGEVDAVATSSLRKGKNEKVLSQFGTEPFYVMVRDGDRELLELLNYAIQQMNNSEGDWPHDLYMANYEGDADKEIFFSDEEKDFIRRYSSGEQELVIATDTNWIPFSWKENGEFIGILPAYIDRCMKLSGMKYRFYDGAEAVHDETPLEDPEVDLYISYSRNQQDTEDESFLFSDVILNSSAAYLTRRGNAVRRVIAICDTTQTLNRFLPMPEGAWVETCKDTEAAKTAVLNGIADAAFLYAYDAEYTANHDATGTLAYELLPDLNFEISAIMRNTDDHTLMSILMKCSKLISETEESQIISGYLSYAASDLTLADYINLHPVLVATVIIVLLSLTFLFVAAQIRNASEQRHRQALEEAMRQTQAANKAKTDFLFSMSHDIRTPMNAIIGFTDLLEKNYHDEEKCRGYLAKIHRSSDFLLSLINNVLEMARIDSGKMQLNEEVWNVSEFNDALSNVFEEQMQKKNITFTSRVHIEHDYVICDTVKLREVFLNILSNAFKYTPAGGSVSIELTELPCDRDGWVMMQTIIADNGIGMSGEFLPHLFDEFSRERTATESRIQGTGLGMPIVKKLVDFMGGTIDVVSEPGQGTTFTVRICHRIADAMELTESERIHSRIFDFSGKRILLAEDNELNAEIAIEILEETGAQVDCAADGVICVNMLEQAPAGTYDLILMDIQMPNMDGYKATELIRSFKDPVKRRIPIIAMTANAFEEDRQNAFAAGMDGHLAKPIDIPMLMETLADVLL